MKLHETEDFKRICSALQFEPVKDDHGNLIDIRDKLSIVTELARVIVMTLIILGLAVGIVMAFASLLLTLFGVW